MFSSYFSADELVSLWEPAAAMGLCQGHWTHESGLVDLEQTALRFLTCSSRWPFVACFGVQVGHHDRCGILEQAVLSSDGKGLLPLGNRGPCPGFVRLHWTDQAVSSSCEICVSCTFCSVNP